MKEPLFDVRSDEVQEILGQIPGKVTRWGIVSVFVFILLLITGSWIFKYPDIIVAPVTIISQNPPAMVVARSTGKIEKIFIEDKQMVEVNQPLAMIENNAIFDDINSLRHLIDTLNGINISDDTCSFISLKTSLKLGDVQQSYLNFIKSYSEFKQFFKLDYYFQKIKSLKKEISKNQSFSDRLNKQKKILVSDKDLYFEKFKRDSGLYSKGVISLTQFEDSRSELMKKKISYEEIMTNLANNQIRISQIEQDILDNQLKRQERKDELNRNLHNSFEDLCNQMNTWDNKFLLKSPVKGKVSLNKVWSPNQNVNTGDRIFTVIPADSGRLVGKADLGLRGAGKVRKGQTVNIKLDNYPYTEYGMIIGKVSSISLVPQDSCYAVEIRLPEDMKTNFGKHLVRNQKLQGKAEIITDEVRLLERIFNPLRIMLKEHTGD